MHRPHACYAGLVDARTQFGKAGFYNNFEGTVSLPPDRLWSMHRTGGGRHCVSSRHGRCPRLPAPRMTGLEPR